ncbi:MAG: hypothetical protein FWF51_09025 [Chitinivibrionia bacterium]|nr:hypothetical protein [Chitinivibrionia bacterium]
MKKLDFFKVFAVALLATTMAFSEPVLQKGDNALGFGLILGWVSGIGVATSFDHIAINDMFSFGGGIDYSVKKQRLLSTYLGHRNRYLTPSFRFAWHILALPVIAEKVKEKSKHDVYVGVRSGAEICWSIWDKNYWNANVRSTSTSASFFFDPVGGYRFYFSEKVNFIAEIGAYDINVGIGFKF